MNKNNDNEFPSYKLHVMPPPISDDDISALFNGILNVVKKKFELEKNAEIINLNLNQERILKELNEKKAEIARLKNEIIYLKSQLKK
ncbi:MAG: hypothetical protein IKY10_00260 [Clostridia bacterium]|nr:hypothetical protein [Clostridia bacterium]